MVSIIFVYYNTPRELIESLNSIKEAVRGYVCEVIIINNNSSVRVPAKAIKTLVTRFISNKTNVGYGRALNQGAKMARGKYLLLSNPDIIFQKGAISLMIKKLEENPAIGIIGPQFLDSKRRIRKVGADMPFLPQAIFPLSSLNNIFPRNIYSRRYYLNDFDGRKEMEVPVLCGACMMISKFFFNKVKGFDERFFMYFEEADICYRVTKAGFKILYYPYSKVIHFVGRSSDDKKWIEKTFEKSRYEFFKKYHGWLIGTIGESIIRLLNLPAKLL